MLKKYKTNLFYVQILTSNLKEERGEGGEEGRKRKREQGDDGMDEKGREKGTEEANMEEKD